MSQITSTRPHHDDRRRHHRGDITLEASLGYFDGLGPMSSIHGHTVNLSPGGCLVELDGLFPPGEDATVFIELDEGPPLVSEAAIVGHEPTGDRWLYRLVFENLDDEDRSRVRRILGA